MADWMFMLARTDPDAPKHRGITYFLLDMKSPGVTVRPLINMGNMHNFNEVFFEDVRVPARNVLGEVDRGWYIGTTTLDFERSSIGNSVGQRQVLEYYLRYIKQNAVGVSGTVKGEIADRWIEAMTAKNLSYRVITIQAEGRVPNHEASIAKMFNTELSQRIARTAMKVLGTAGLLTDAKQAPMKGRVAASYLATVSSTIAGGTSEIQRNIVATRGLGLPRA
jgi:alkylation response protein AidB-like acyl-CoA dehydrogenase